MDKVTNIPGRKPFQTLILSDKTVEGWDVQSCTNLTGLCGMEMQDDKLAYLDGEDMSWARCCTRILMSPRLIFPVSGKWVCG